MADKGIIFQNLIAIANKKGIAVKFVDFKMHDGLVIGNKMGVRAGMSIDDINYNIAHELAHCFLHYDKGDTINAVNHDEYEEQADRAAQLLLFTINQCIECGKAGAAA